MNRIIERAKVVLVPSEWYENGAFVALQALAGYAQEVEAEEEGPVGWTAVCVGLATPVQLPWGLDRWDVFGIDFNVFYSDAPLMYGIDVGGLCALTRDDMMGIKVSGLLNFACSDVYGLRAFPRYLLTYN